NQQSLVDPRHTTESACYRRRTVIRLVTIVVPGTVGVSIALVTSPVPRTAPRTVTVYETDPPATGVPPVTRRSSVRSTPAANGWPRLPMAFSAPTRNGWLGLAGSAPGSYANVMSSVSLTPIQTWKWRSLVVPNTFTRHSTTSQVFTPSVSVVARMP